MENTNYIVTAYNLQTTTGNIRKATRVIFSDGYEVDFMDSMPRQLAISQAVQFRERDTARALAALQSKVQGAFYATRL